VQIGGVDEETTKKGIPSFWLTALSTHPTIGSLVTEEDVPALDALADVSCSYADDFTSFTLTFTFDDNDFFTNKVIFWCKSPFKSLYRKFLFLSRP
jgi:nucleosome assembly protein 1-like 1